MRHLRIMGTNESYMCMLPYWPQLGYVNLILLLIVVRTYETRYKNTRNAELSILSCSKKVDKSPYMNLLTVNCMLTSKKLHIQ